MSENGQNLFKIDGRRSISMISKQKSDTKFGSLMEGVKLAQSVFHANSNLNRSSPAKELEFLCNFSMEAELPKSEFEDLPEIALNNSFEEFECSEIEKVTSEFSCQSSLQKQVIEINFPVPMRDHSNPGMEMEGTNQNLFLNESLRESQYQPDPLNEAFIESQQSISIMSSQHHLQN